MTTKTNFLFFRFTEAVGSQFYCAAFLCGRKSEGICKKFYGTVIFILQSVGETCSLMWLIDIQPSPNILPSAALLLGGARGLGNFVIGFLFNTQIDTHSVELL